MEAKYAIYKILESRGIPEGDYRDLIESVNDYNSSIEELTYLSNIGFTHKQDGNSLIILRSTKANVWDIVGIFLGFILMLSLGSALNSWKIILFEKFQAQLLFGASLNTSIGILGFFLFYKGLNRFVEYSGFRIESGDNFLLIKKQGISTIESSLTKSDLYFEEDDDKAILGMNSSEKVPLITASENFIFKATLKSLYDKLSK
ncbi:MAG: hypothetical protein RLN88_06425 [Ekhidna sp.]|uniref:hypothetical protein n=1 Tax=Ekhidna sp. TaxID=2608089 RepID=UPI0032EF5E39